jgi:hypothetical protein
MNFWFCHLWTWIVTIHLQWRLSSITSIIRKQSLPYSFLAGKCISFYSFMQGCIINSKVIGNVIVNNNTKVLKLVHFLHWKQKIVMTTDCKMTCDNSKDNLWKLCFTVCIIMLHYISSKFQTLISLFVVLDSTY